MLARKLALFVVPLVVVLGLISVGSYTGTSLAGRALIGVAHADSGSVAVPASDGGTSLLGYLVVGVAFVGGLIRLLDIVIPGLKWLAPRTSSTVDDSALAFAQAAHDRLDALENVLAKIVPTPSPKTPQAGFARLGVMLAMSLIVGLAACAALKTEAKALEAGVVTCAKADQGKVQALALQLGSEALSMAVLHGAIDWTALAKDAEAGAKSQGLEVAACSFGGLVAQLNTLLHPGADAIKVSSGGPEAFVDVAGGDAVLASFQAAHGITSIR